MLPQKSDQGAQSLEVHGTGFETQGFGPFRRTVPEMIGPVLQRYGFELIEDPQRLRNLVEYQCQKQHVPPPGEDTWLPVQERWLSGWPLRGSSQFVDRYRHLRTGLIRRLGGGSLESWLEQLPAITVMPTPRAEVEVGRQRGSQPNIAEALARLGWGGRVTLDGTPQSLPANLAESELQITGSEEQPTQVTWDRVLWRAGWLRLENLSLQGELNVAGGLVELHACVLQPGARIRLQGPGAFLTAHGCDLFGDVEVAACALLEAVHCNFERSSTGLDCAGLAELQGTALCSHPQVAVRLRERARALFSDCQLRDSGQGLLVEERSRATLRACWVQANRGSGVSAGAETELELDGCNVRDNGQDGLRLSGQAHVRLSNNTIQGNRGAGVRWHGAVMLEKSANSMRDNSEGDWLESPP